MGSVHTRLIQPATANNNLAALIKAGVQEGKVIRADVVFGAPSLGCRGTGICKITAFRATGQEEQRRSCRRCTALLTPYLGGKGISIILPAAFLCVNIVRNHLRNNVLIISEMLALPVGFRQQLDLQLTNIEPGAYVVESYPGFFRINIS